MANSSAFKDDLSDFVRIRAQGNKTRAASMLDITRPEIHAYLKGRMPRTDKLSRLKAAISTDNIPANEPQETAEQASAEMAFQLIRYLYHLVENARARPRR